MDLKKITICIDAGHSETTSGKRSLPFLRDVDIDNDGIIDIKKGEVYKEHSANVMVANFLAELLTKRGFSIFKSGWNDANAKDDLVDMGIEDRQRAIRNAKCDYVISVHFNASGSTTGKFDSAEGVSVYVRTEKEKRGDSDRFASVILGELVKGTKQKNRGIGNGKFGMCNATGMNVKSAILIEHAFMTNEREAHELMANEDFCRECATEIYRGVLNYLGVKEFDLDAFVEKVQAPLLLQRGVKGELVKLAQERLISLGYDLGKWGADGDFGGATETAIKLFQAKVGLAQSGVIDIFTWAEMCK